MNRLREWWRRHFGEYARREREALLDGTRVRLLCAESGCRFRDHDGVWRTSWTPRRLNDMDAPNDYELTREHDGRIAYAIREAIEPLV